MLFSLIWSIALAGIYLKLRFRGKYHRFHVMNYAALGWIALFAMPQLKAHLPEGALDRIVAGGVLAHRGYFLRAGTSAVLPCNLAPVCAGW